MSLARSSATVEDCKAEAASRSAALRAFSASFLALASAFFAPFLEGWAGSSTAAAAEGVGVGVRAGSVGISWGGSEDDIVGN